MCIRPCVEPVVLCSCDEYRQPTIFCSSLSRACPICTPSEYTPSTPQLPLRAALCCSQQLLLQLFITPHASMACLCSIRHKINTENINWNLWSLGTVSRKIRTLGDFSRGQLMRGVNQTFCERATEGQVTMQASTSLLALTRNHKASSKPHRASPLLHN